MNKNNQAKLNTKSSKLSELKSIIIIVLFALAIRTFIFELFYVPTGSMRATILEGDYIFATKYDYGYSIYSIPFSPNIFQGRVFSHQPKRGDVVIMRPPHNMEERYIKRLIGLPGDKIKIKDDLIYINDLPIKRERIGTFTSEDKIRYIKFKETLPNNVSYFSYILEDRSDRLHTHVSNYGPRVVEEGKYFFLGDNRDNSGDSRYQLNTVDFRNFIAKGKLIVFSTKITFWDKYVGFFGQITRIGQWLASIRVNRICDSLYISDK